MCVTFNPLLTVFSLQPNQPKQLRYLLQYNTSGGVGVSRMYEIKLLTRSRFFGRQIGMDAV